MQPGLCPGIARYIQERHLWSGTAGWWAQVRHHLTSTTLRHPQPHSWNPFTTPRWRWEQEEDPSCELIPPIRQPWKRLCASRHWFLKHPPSCGEVGASSYQVRSVSAGGKPNFKPARASRYTALGALIFRMSLHFITCPRGMTGFVHTGSASFSFVPTPTDLNLPCFPKNWLSSHKSPPTVFYLAN